MQTLSLATDDWASISHHLTVAADKYETNAAECRALDPAEFGSAWGKSIADQFDHQAKQARDLADTIRTKLGV